MRAAAKSSAPDIAFKRAYLKLQPAQYTIARLCAAHGRAEWQSTTAAYYDYDLGIYKSQATVIRSLAQRGFITIEHIGEDTYIDAVPQLKDMLA